MNNIFSLGLLINLTDNASGGLNNLQNSFNNLNGLLNNLQQNSGGAVNAIQALSVAGIGMGIVGQQFVNVGSKITNLFSTLAKSTTQVGQTMKIARIQLSALYGSVDEGNRVINDVRRYAESSIFNFEDLIPSVVMLKSNGIEAFNEIISTSGKAKGTLMDFASDLASFNPFMRNQYGTGIQAAMGALNEYIAEGNAISLKRSTSLDILGILGEDKGKTIEERSRQIADLMEKTNMLGTVKAMTGEPMQQISNMKDKLFTFMSEVSESGVWDKFKSIVNNMYGYVFSITDEEIKSIAKTISEGLLIVIKPIEWIVSGVIKIVDSFRQLNKTNPHLAKLLVVMTALLGVFLVGGGLALKLGGSLLLLTTAFLQMKLVLGLTMPSLVGVSKVLGVMLIKLAVLGVAVYGLYKIWDSNFMGIKDSTLKNIKFIADTFNLLFDALADNELSQEQYDLMQKLGLTNFIEGMLIAKYHIELFVKGFKQGFSDFFKELEQLEPIFKPIKDFLQPILDIVGNILKDLLGEDTEQWAEKIGYYIGKFAGACLIALPLVFALSFAVGLLTNPFTALLLLAGLLFVAWQTNFLGIRDLVDNLFEMWSNIDWDSPFINSMKKVIGGVVTFVEGFIQVTQGILDFIVGVFTGNWDRAWNGLVSIASGVANMIKGAFEVAINGVIGLIQGIGTAFNEVMTLINGHQSNSANSIGRNQYAGSTGRSGSFKTTALSTGGEINAEGLAYLHPNEVVVNGDLTNKLRSFLNNKSDVYNTSSNSNNISNDFSISFGENAININVANTDETNLEKVAVEIMKKIERKQQLRSMAVRG